MQEIGIESSLFQDILAGKKTVEIRLGKSKYIKMCVGDTLSIREDVWQGDRIVSSMPDQARIIITQLLYFEYLEEALDSIGFQAAIPSATSKKEALARYRTFYTAKDEEEYGVIAITFSLV